MPTTRRVAFADLAAEIATEVRLLRAITAELAVHADAREIEKGREGPPTTSSRDNQTLAFNTQAQGVTFPCRHLLPWPAESSRIRTHAHQRTPLDTGSSIGTRKVSSILSANAAMGWLETPRQESHSPQEVACHNFGPMSNPPSMTYSAPVQYELSSHAKKTTNRAISSGSAHRGIGKLAWT